LSKPNPVENISVPDEHEEEKESLVVQTHQTPLDV